MRLNYNYVACGKDLMVDFRGVPDLVSDKYPLKTAAWFFHKNNIHVLADKGSDIETVKLITKRVNGGYNGLDHRIERFNTFYKAMQ